MSENRCKAETKSGERCKLKAGDSGYCHLHDPEKKKKREKIKKEEKTRKNKMKEIMDIIKSICSAKGWHYSIDNCDENNWRYVTVSVSRYYDSSKVRGIFEVNMSKDGIRISPQKTSFKSYGLKDLSKAIISEVKQLPWMKSDDKTEKNSLTNSKLDQLISMLKNFDKFARQIQSRYNNRDTLVIKDEYDVQDILHALLKLIFKDIRPEDYTPNYAGSSSRVDFLIKDENIIIETKMANKRLRDKLIGEQLITDIKRYQSHPNCKILICFIYDPNYYIKNPVAIEEDLSEKYDDLEVIIIVIPK